MTLAALLVLFRGPEAVPGDDPPKPPPAGIRVSEVTLHGDMDCFRVETPTATYVYGKKGAGFASILDADGRDWVSYRPGNAARGEYRGLPKCGQPTKFFHCGYGYGQYKTANVFTSRVTVKDAGHVRVVSETLDKKTAGTWDFYPTHATFTLLRIDQPTFWFLYEGTPGGKLDADTDFVIRPDGTKTTLDKPWSERVPWVCFGAGESPAGFFCVNHQQPEAGETDSYVSWPFQKDKDGSFQDMTVFGFGRKGYKGLVKHVPDLTKLPARYSIGFVPKSDHATAKVAVEKVRAAVEAPPKPPGKPARPQSLNDLAAPKPLAPADLPDGFSEQVVATGLTGATAMAVAPDGRIFVCEQTGTLRAIRDGKLLAEPFLSVKVDSSWERGLIGVTLDPDFPRKPFVYVCYVAADPYPHHRVSRFTAAGDAAVPGSEVILLKGDDQTKLGGKVPNGHQGGPLRFGKDGKLYVAIGEQTAGLPSQKMDTFQGKLLRINPDGSIPEDNPFFTTAAGKYRAIWALGLRNPFALAVQPGTGRMFINDVGEARWEEIDEAAGGANYGWPHAEGFSANPAYRNPVHAYDRSQGKSITGGVFYNPPVSQFPKEYAGKYFFAEFIDNWVRVLDPDHPRDVRGFATGLAGPVDVQVGPDGSLYYLNRNAWVKDTKFTPNTGSVHRVIYVANAKVPAPRITAHPREMAAGVGRRVTLSVAADGETPLHYQWSRNGQPVSGGDGPALSFSVIAADDGAEYRCLVSNAHGTTRSRPAALWTTPLPPLLDRLRVGPNPQELPRLLSQTGVFESLADLTPAAGVLPYDVNAPLWSDGAAKRRWVVLPKQTRIGFAPRGAWKFPPGTVFVKHFDLPAEDDAPARRLETRLLVVDRRGTGYGVTYRWRTDATDAELLADGATEEIDRGGRKQSWSFPSRTDCLVCHTPAAGFVLGVNTRQLNRPGTDSPLSEWNRRSLFDPAIRDEDVPRLDRLAAVTDTIASPEHRVRSYLDANCAQCHRPGGTRAGFDARFDASLHQLVGQPVASSDLGIAGAVLVAPKDPARSMVYQRMARRRDVFNMPPLATCEADRAALAVLEQWIMSLPKKPR